MTGGIWANGGENRSDRKQIMNITISKLTSTDLDAVDNLMKHDSKTLGFLPRQALLDYFKKEGVLGAKTIDGQLVGYLLYAAYSDYFRIAHLCVSEKFRAQGIARRFVDELKEAITTQKTIRLRCRRDFPAHKMWPELGFVPLDEKTGRSAAGHLLTHWCLTLAPDDQLSLFQAKISAESLDVVIDAQVFFDFYEADNDKTKPSKALFNDFSMDSLNLWITDELFVEINRAKNSSRRKKSRERAHSFPRIEHNPQSMEHFEEVLSTILPDNNANQKSDIRHLAKTAASDVDIFVTRDQNLLKKSEKITAQANLRVLSPTDLIIQLHELSGKQSYVSRRISGVGLKWERLASANLASLPLTAFLNHHETKGKFREKLDSLLASPDHNECEILRSGNDILAIRVLTHDSDEILTVLLARVARPADRLLFGRFLIANTVYKAMERNLDMVKFEASALTSSLVPDLLDIGFTECNDSFVRFCFPRCLSHEEVLSTISELCTESINNYRDMSDIDLERHCSPLSLASDQGYFLVPIKPGYAMSLIDSLQSADDLFGGKTSVLLRWDHVYYRSKTHHHMLKPPARILWYESRPKRQIVAVSHLDAVEIDAPKALFKKFKKFGILEWRNIFQMCAGDTLKEIMVLKFSHTFPFRKPISLDTTRTVYKDGGANLTLQSPSKVPTEIFQKLFQLGYPEQA